MAVTIGSVVFIAIGLAFLAGGSLLYSKKKRQKSTSARLEEIFAEYSMYFGDETMGSRRNKLEMTIRPE